MTYLQIKKRYLEKICRKIEILSTHNLLCWEFAAVYQNSVGNF